MKMKPIETVGNIKVFSEVAGNSIAIRFYNGSDLVASEIYFNTKEENAIADLFTKKLDTYTEEWLWLHCLTEGLVKLSDNTYRMGEKDWFCRIDDTRYFKHIHKSADEFVIDKRGNKIIDR